MKNLFTILVAASLFSSSFGQSTPLVDSLLTKLKHADEDTNKVIILLNLFDPTVIHNLDLADEYTDQALKLSEQLSFEKGMAAAYQRKGIIWSYRGNVAKSRENYLKAIEVHKRLNKELIAATLIHNLGLLYKEQGIYDSALIFAEQASEIFLAHKDSLKYASSLDMTSSVHSEMGNYFLSLKNAMKAAELFRKYGDELREADALIKLGQAYSYRDDELNAIKYYMSAIELYRKHGDAVWENYSLHNIAKAYLAINDLDKADSVLDYSIQLSDSLGAIQMLGEGYDIKGDIFFARGDYDKALGFFNKALITNKDAEDSTFIATNKISIARCYQQMGQLDKSMRAYLEVIPITIKMGVKENLKTIYANLSEIYEKKGQLATSLQYHKKYQAIKDSIYNMEISRQFADMQAKYDTERKEREIAMKSQTITILKQKSEIQELLRLRLIITLIVIVIFFILGLYVLWLRNKRNKLRQDIENERLTHELQMKKRELATHTLHIIQKNELLETLQNKVAELKKRDNSQGSSYNEISRLINTSRLIDRDWENFKSVFEQVHPDFFSKLKSLYSTISSNELRMAAMMKMNLNTKEMASILNITPESVKKARYRMRKKFELEEEANVQDYLMSL